MDYALQNFEWKVMKRESSCDVYKQAINSLGGYESLPKVTVWTGGETQYTTDLESYKRFQLIIKGRS